MNTADLIIIGAGPGGYPAALAGVADGLKVVMIERRELGGTCLNRGCIPTKAMCRTAQIALDVAEAPKFGINAGPAEIDYSMAAARRDNVVRTMRDGLTSSLSKVDIVSGNAVVKSTSPVVVEVNGEEYTAPRLIVATGAEPSRLRIEGAELAMTSDEILASTEKPASLAIIGGGVIGLEFASIMAALGVKVTIIEFLPEILPPCDADIAKRLRTSLKRRGIEIITDAAVTAIRPGLVIEYTRRGAQKTVEAEAALMAVGRRAVVPEGLNVELNRNGSIAVNPDTFETSAAGVYAVGDCNGLCQLAHAATAQAMMVMGHEQVIKVIPSAVFTSPEVAMVGMTEAQAVAAGHDVVVGKAMFHSNGKAVAMGETDGLVKIIADRDTNLLLGAFIMGPHAADLIEEPALAMSTRVPVREIVATVHAHPTLGEALLPAYQACC